MAFVEPKHALELDRLFAEMMNEGITEERLKRFIAGPWTEASKVQAD